MQKYLLVTGTDIDLVPSHIARINFSHIFNPLFSSNVENLCNTGIFYDKLSNFTETHVTTLKRDKVSFWKF